MKQRLFLCVSLIACLMVSCKNEDIAVSRDVAFNVNPYSIVAGFSRHEVNSGDLVDFGCSANPDYYKLRTYLLVYDMDGSLIESLSLDLDNYNDNMTATVSLPDGVYNVVAIAHIMDVQNDVPCWNVMEMNHLNSFRIVNNEELDNLWFKLLGVDSRKVEVGVGKTVCDISMKPVGSLFINYFRSIHYYDNYVCYQMFMDKEPNDITFDNNGLFDASYHSSISLSYPSSFVLRPEEYPQDQNDVYWYSFLPPMGLTSFEWHAWESVDGSSENVGPSSVIIQEGKVFMSIIDLQAGFNILELMD